ncbi:MAG: hypothetical protein ACRDE2_04380, partial [Chitinophagaceae bacterium]
MPLLALHQQRFEKTQAEAFGKIIHPSLNDLIYQQVLLYQNMNAGKFKCRIVYDDKHVSIEFISYLQAKINHLKIVEDDQI